MKEFDYMAFQAKVLEEVKSINSMLNKGSESGALLTDDILNGAMGVKSDAHITEKKRNPDIWDNDFDAKQILTEKAISRIIDLYASGNSVREICDWMETNLEYKISGETVNLVTDCVLPEIQSWRSRPLDSVYSIIWVDALRCKVMNDQNRPVTQTLYSLLAVDCNGYKDIPGMYMSENADSDFWLSVFTDLKSRGVNDILLICSDDLSGFSDAVNTLFPNTVMLNSVVHLVRNSLKYAASKNRKELLKDMKKIYQSENKEKAEEELNKFKSKWNQSYPIVIKSWQEKWPNLSDYFQYPESIRRIIYSTNAVENYHTKIRKSVKTKGVFSNDSALKKLIYLVYRNIRKKWTMPLSNWGQTAQQLAIHFNERFNFFK